MKQKLTFSRLIAKVTDDPRFDEFDLRVIREP